MVDRKIARLGWILLVIGLVLLAGAGFAARAIRAFVDAAGRAEGTVIGLVESESTDSDGRRHRTYHPAVEFRLPSGEVRRFTSDAGASPPDHEIGERVTVLYEREDPEDARLPGTFALWGIAIIPAVFGAVLGVPGFAIVAVRAARKRREARLRRRGRRVQARITSVARNGNVTVMGHHPYRILCEWHDPETGRVHAFRSRSVYFDPTPFLKGEEIAVFVDPRDPRRHAVDVDFLPGRGG
jgi:hypothetical protein